MNTRKILIYVFFLFVFFSVFFFLLSLGNEATCIYDKFYLQKAKMALQHTVTNTIYNRRDNMVNELLQSKSVYVWWF